MCWARPNRSSYCLVTPTSPIVRCTTGENAVVRPAVVDGHLADGVPEDLLRRRRRALGRAIHLQDQVVQLPVVADGAQAALERLELFRHEDLDRLVLEIAVGTSRQLDGVLGADLQRLLERLADLHLAEPAALRDRQLGPTGTLRQLLEELVELGGGARRGERDGERGQERPARRAHRFSGWAARRAAWRVRRGR